MVAVNYLQSLADAVRRELPDAELPKDEAESLLLLYGLLVALKGVEVTDEDVHDAWTAWKTLLGADHGSMVPFDQLDDDTRASDAPFTEAIRRAAASASK